MKLLGRARRSSRLEGYPSALRISPLRPPTGPWVGSHARVKDAQGNTGLSCLLDPPSALQWGEVWQGRWGWGCPLSILLLFGCLTAKQGVVTSLLALLWDTNTWSHPPPCLDSPLVLPIRAGVGWTPVPGAGSPPTWGTKRQRLERQNWALAMPLLPVCLPSVSHHGPPGLRGAGLPAATV